MSQENKTSGDYSKSTDSQVEEEIIKEPNVTKVDSQANKEDNTETIYEKSDNRVSQSNTSSSLTEEELEKLFADRYTEANPSYAKICKGFDPVIVVHPWTSRTKRMYDYTRGGGDRGRGWRGGRGGWRGGGDRRYDNRGNDNQERRDNGFSRKRRWEDSSSGDRGSNPRVSYPFRQ